MKFLYTIRILYKYYSPYSTSYSRNNSKLESKKIKAFFGGLTLSRIIEIQANSDDDAFSNIQNLYKNEEIVLYADDYVETEFLKSEE